MHTFKIVRELNGWAIQLGCAMTAPCKSQAAAVEQAERMAHAIRRHGETVAVVMDLADDSDAAAFAETPRAAAAARVRTPRRVQRAK